METLLYIFISVAVSFLAIVAAILSTIQHHEAWNKAGAMVMGGGAFWVLMSSLEVSSSNLSTKLVYYRMHFIGVFVVTTSWLVLAMLVSGHERWVNRRSIAALSIVPLIVLFLAFTNQSQNSFFGINFALNSVNPFFSLNVTEGLGFWLLETAYSYALILTGIAITVARVNSFRRHYRLQSFPTSIGFFFLFVSSLPLILNVLYHYNVSWFMYIDPTPVTLTVASILMLWRLVYLPGIDVIPIAHEILIDNLLEALIVLDAGNRIVELNPKAQDLIGHAMSEAVGKPIETIWAEWGELRNELGTGAETEKEVTLNNGNDPRVYELHTSSIELVGNLPYRLVTLRDVTARKLVEEKLREAERMATIGETATMVGHDLRNPLQGISTAAYVLKQKWGSTGDQETTEMLEIIESSLGYADNIVKDLMDYSREVRLELTESTAKAVAGAALLQVKIPENVTVRDMTRETPRVMIDAAKTQRVIVNLLRNAVDAMPKGGQITLSSSESNGILVVKVTDTGEGISNSVMENLWKPFKTTKQKGTGLGLAICKRIVEAQGGTIQVESTVGKGSTFSLAIPINRRTTKLQPALGSAAAHV